ERLAGADRRHFLPQDLGLFRIEAAATIFAGPVRHGPALVAHPLEPDPLRLGGEPGIAAAPERILLRRHRPSHLRRTIRLQPGAGLTLKLLEIGHGGVSIARDRIDLSGRIAEFNMPLAATHAAAEVATVPNPVYSAQPQRLRNNRKRTCA